MKATAGETVLLKEGNALRWVRIVHALPEHDGMQLITVQHCDQYGRSKPRRVKLNGKTNRIDWVS